MVAIIVACDGDGSLQQGSPTPSDTLTPTATARPQLVPPFEGGGPQPYVDRQRQNYRENPDYDQPDPDSLPEPGAEQDGPEFKPPKEPTCPDGWEMLDRPWEFFKICFPPDWQIDGEGYVTAGMDDRWYSVGIFKFLPDWSQSAHVSVYFLRPFSRPPQLFIKECDQAYKVTLDGNPAAVCPNAPGQFPEAKIVHYWVPVGDRWTLINVVPYFEKDPDTGAYTDRWSEEDYELAIEIAHTIDFYERSPLQEFSPLPAPFTTPTPSP